MNSKKITIGIQIFILIFGLLKNIDHQDKLYSFQDLLFDLKFYQKILIKDYFTIDIKSLV